MRLKSYFCATVEAAMEMARKELGEDALLVNARPTTAATRSLGALEVVFGLPASDFPAKTAAALSSRTSVPPAPALAAAAGTASKARPERPDQPVLGEAATAERKLGPRGGGIAVGNSHHGSGGDVFQDMAILRLEMERISQALRVTADAAPGGLSSDLNRPAKSPDLYRRLLDGELAPAIARQVADGAGLEEFVAVNPTLGALEAGSRTDSASQEARPQMPVVVALVGPPGAGKTTTLIKLAARYGLAARRPTQILSADVERIAAADQLRVLAAILGMGCTVVETARALAQAIEEHRHKDFIFIDTPGFAAGEIEQAAELAAFLAGSPAIDTHLVLPASMRGADLARVTDLYGIFRPAKLLFTKMDETRHFGALVSESVRCGLPLSFLCMGQSIPDHLEAASQDILTALILADKRAPGQERTTSRQLATQRTPAYSAGRSTPKHSPEYAPRARKLAAVDFPQVADFPQNPERPLALESLPAPVPRPGLNPHPTAIGNAPAKARAAGAGA